MGAKTHHYIVLLIKTGVYNCMCQKYARKHVENVLRPFKKWLLIVLGLLGVNGPHVQSLVEKDGKKEVGVN